MTAMFVFIETRLFTRLADEHLPDDELWRLQAYLNDNAEAGDIIRGSGGVRKLRWAATGRGKRRIIYYLRSKQGEMAAYVVCEERGPKHCRPGSQED